MTSEAAGIQAKRHVNLRLLSYLFWKNCNVGSLIVQRTLFCEPPNFRKQKFSVCNHSELTLS